MEIKQFVVFYLYLIPTSSFVKNVMDT